MNDKLMCNGSRRWACWNSIGFSGALAAQRVVEAITTELAALDGFDDQFREILETASRASDADPARVWAELDRNEKEVMRKQENLLAAIADFGPKPEFRE